MRSYKARCTMLTAYDQVTPAWTSSPGFCRMHAQLPEFRRESQRRRQHAGPACSRLQGQSASMGNPSHSAQPRQARFPPHARLPLRARRQSDRRREHAGSVHVHGRPCSLRATQASGGGPLRLRTTPCQNVLLGWLPIFTVATFSPMLHSRMHLARHWPHRQATTP